MKKLLFLVTVVVLCLALVIGVACGGEEEKAAKEVKFGYGLPMSGVYGAMLGIPTKQALELAAERIGEFSVDGKSYRWNIIVDDNQSTSAGGVATTTKFIYEDGAKFIHQFGTDSAMAAQPICEEAGVILDQSAGIEALGPDKPHTIQVCPTARWNSPAFFSWFTETHPEVKTFVTCMPDNATGRMMGEAAVDAAEYFGLEVIGQEYVAAGTTEYYPIATRIADLNPDLLDLEPGPLPALLELGWDGYVCYGYWMSAYGGLYGWDKVQGFMAFYPVPTAEEMPQALLDFAAEYQTRYDTELSMYPFYGIMTLWVLTDAMKKAGTVDDVDKIIATLETETLDTPIGQFNFTGEELFGINHLLRWPVWVGEVQGQEYVIVEEVAPEEAEALALAVEEASK